MKFISEDNLKKTIKKHLRELFDYRGEHTAPGPDSDDSPMHNVEDKFGDDIYGPQAVRMFGYHETYDQYSIFLIQNAHNKPNMKVKIYRAVPKVITNQEKIDDYQKRMKYILKTGKLPNDVDNWPNTSEYYEWLDDEIKNLEANPTDEEKVKINPGDWVTINFQYAKEHGQAHLGNKFRILSKTVTAKDLYTNGDDVNEWGYFPSNLTKQVDKLHPFKKIKSFKTSEGNFSIYDTQTDVRDRANMFTVHENPDGWVIRNAIVPDDQQRKGIATDFYIKMNELSKQQTGNPLRSTQPRKLSNGEIVHELSDDGIKLWDSFVEKGLANKHSHKNYSFI